MRRLNLQHYLWRSTLGFSIHPSVQLSSDARVADVATGTGIWAFEAADDFPSTVSFDGFDVSDAEFPPANFWPGNVQLHKLDAMQDPPESLRAKYDLVHVRLLVAVVEDNDPSKILDHCILLLSMICSVRENIRRSDFAAPIEPGGILQWDEVDPPAFRVLSIGSGAPAQCLQALSDAWRSYKSST